MLLRKTSFVLKQMIKSGLSSNFHVESILGIVRKVEGLATTCKNSLFIFKKRFGPRIWLKDYLGATFTRLTRNWLNFPSKQHLWDSFHHLFECLMSQSKKDTHRFLLFIGNRNTFPLLFYCLTISDLQHICGANLGVNTYKNCDFIGFIYICATLKHLFCHKILCYGIF